MRNQILNALLIVGLAASCFATTIHVPGDQPTIQAGLNSAVEDDTVLVAAGTYYENIIWPAVNGIKLIGSGQEECIIDGNHQTSVIRFECESVVIDTSTMLAGFTITSGHADGGGIHCRYASPTLTSITLSDNYGSFGGGIYCLESSPVLIDVTVSHNDGYYYGGGIYCNSSSLSLTNVTITFNQTNSMGQGYDGGGVYCTNSSLFMENVTISGNHAGEDYSCGGGMYCRNSNLVLTDVMICNNSTYQGGGIYCRDSNLTLANLTIYSNSADTDGAGIYCGSSHLVMENVKVTHNDSSSQLNTCKGGGIYIGYSYAVLECVTVTQNMAQGDYGGYGGGIYCNISRPVFVNVTVSDNSANSDGGGIYCARGAHPSLSNCILWNNAPQEVFFSQNWDPDSITISCSDIQGGESGIETNDNGTVYWLENNIDADPLFCDPQNDIFYRLRLDSPCRTDVCGFMGYTGETCDGEGVEDRVAAPSGFYLAEAYPNPLNPSTAIEYSLPTPCNVTLSVYNINGQLVDVIHEGFMPAGQYSVSWIPGDLPSGIYLVELRAGAERDIIKVSYIK